MWGVLTAAAGAIWPRLRLWLSLAGAVALAVGLAFLKGRSAGKKAYEDRAKDARLKALQTEKEVRDDVEAASDDDLDRRLSKWMRDDE